MLKTAGTKLEAIVRQRSYASGRGLEECIVYSVFLCVEGFSISLLLISIKVTHLVIKRPQFFHYKPGDYVYLNIPAIAKYEWHPFTISSAPEQEGMWGGRTPEQQHFAI